MYAAPDAPSPSFCWMWKSLRDLHSSSKLESGMLLTMCSSSVCTLDRPSSVNTVPSRYGTGDSGGEARGRIEVATGNLRNIRTGLLFNNEVFNFKVRRSLPSGTMMRLQNSEICFSHFRERIREALRTFTMSLLRSILRCSLSA